MNTKPVQEFIIQSEENLRIAWAVEEALPNARHKVAVDFLARLAACLKESLPGWRSENENENFFSVRWAGCSFWKPEWEGQYRLGLQFAEYGREMVFGVSREKDKIGDRPFCSELISAIKQVNPMARAQQWWWEARIPMESPAADWRKPEVLWRMQTDGKFLEDVAAQLLKLAKISEPFVDQLVEKYRK